MQPGDYKRDVRTSHRTHLDSGLVAHVAEGEADHNEGKQAHKYVVSGDAGRGRMRAKDVARLMQHIVAEQRCGR